MKKYSIVSLMVLLLPIHLLGQCNPKRFDDPLLEKLAGQWTLTGKIGERPVENNFTAQWVLNHQFLELNFADVATPPTYFAKVSIGYDCTTARYVAHWLDSFGGQFSIKGTGEKKEETIEFVFEYPDGPFVNKFIYDSQQDTWHFHMTGKNAKGEWTVFGDEYLKRRK